MRQLLSATLRQKSGSERFDFIQGQHGMFSLLGIGPAQVTRLRQAAAPAKKTTKK